MPTFPSAPPPEPRKNKTHSRTTTERGYGHAHQKSRNQYLRQHPVCERCGAEWSRHLHHKDRNPHNRDAANLSAMCERCHVLEHRRPT